MPSMQDEIDTIAGNIVDAVSEMYSEKTGVAYSLDSDQKRDNGVRFSVEDTGLTQSQYDRVVDYVNNAMLGEHHNKAPYIQFGTVRRDLIDGLERFGVHVKQGTPHRLEDNYVRHLRNSHGISKAGTWGINDSDIRAIPFIVNKPDRAYYRATDSGLRGILYAKDFIDTTYYVEGILEDGSLSGRQMIKVPLGDVPSMYKNDVTKEKALIALPDGTLSPKSYVQDVTRDRASSNSKTQTGEAVNTPGIFSLDTDASREALTMIDTEGIEDGLEVLKGVKNVGAFALKDVSQFLDAISNSSKDKEANRNLRNTLNAIFEKPHSEATGRYARGVERMQQRVLDIEQRAGVCDAKGNPFDSRPP